MSLINESILSNVTKCYDGLLLRTTIVFGNYLARKHLKQKNKYRYDPVGTFREIKSAIDAKEFENYQLSGVIKNLNQKKINSHLKIKELEHQVQKAKIKYQVLLTKFQKYIKLTNTIKSKYANSIDQIIKEEKKLRSSSAYPSFTKLSYRAQTLNMQKQVKDRDISEKKNKTILKENEKNINKKMIKEKKLNKIVNGFYNVRRKFFLTNDGQKGKRKKGKEIIQEENNINDNSAKNNINISFTKRHFKTETTKINESLESYNDELNSIDKEILLEINNRTLNNKEIKKIQHKKLIELQISKNRDKLIKTNGFNGTENLLMNIKNIMNEVLYSENPKLTYEKNDKDKIEKFESIQQSSKNYPY